MHVPGVNYLAVLVAGVLIFVLGGIWYSLIFAKRWIALMGKTEAEMKAGGGAQPLLFLMAFACGLASAFAMAVILNHFEPVTLARAASVGVLCWLGFAGPTSFATAAF